MDVPADVVGMQTGAVGGVAGTVRRDEGSRVRDGQGVTRRREGSHGRGRVGREWPRGARRA